MTDAERILGLYRALRFIGEWELPSIWDERLQKMVSYESARGSNGAREYMRDRAWEAIRKYFDGD